MTSDHELKLIMTPSMKNKSEPFQTHNINDDHGCHPKDKIPSDASHETNIQYIVKDPGGGGEGRQARHVSLENPVYHE